MTNEATKNEQVAISSKRVKATREPWFAARKRLSSSRSKVLMVLSFLLPLMLWGLVSYVPFLWHPNVEVVEPGGVSYTGIPVNPVYLPAPHEVAIALYTSFTTEPKRRSEQWLHESLWHSVQVIFWGFFLSSLVGVPLGILCGTFSAVSKLNEPFIEFFRYLPAPAFGALAVAILGIHDGPKIAIIFIGTFFQQVLIISNTTKKLDISLIEAGLTLGAKKMRLLFTIIVPGVLPELYRDQRILLGWAWTYLIVAELIGTSSGITWFITQQARYKNFDNVFAAIIIIGVIGLMVDIILAQIGKKLFPWDKTQATI